jgi:hypothetical protein
MVWCREGGRPLEPALDDVGNHYIMGVLLAVSWNVLPPVSKYRSLWRLA